MSATNDSDTLPPSTGPDAAKADAPIYDALIGELGAPGTDAPNA